MGDHWSCQAEVLCSVTKIPEVPCRIGYCSVRIKARCRVEVEREWSNVRGGGYVKVCNWRCVINCLNNGKPSDGTYYRCSIRGDELHVCDVEILWRTRLVDQLEVHVRQEGLRRDGYGRVWTDQSHEDLNLLKTTRSVAGNQGVTSEGQASGNLPRPVHRTSSDLGTKQCGARSTIRVSGREAWIAEG